MNRRTRILRPEKRESKIIFDRKRISSRAIVPVEDRKDHLPDDEFNKSFRRG